MTDDELLAPRPTAANDALKADLLARTAGRLRFDRRIRLVRRMGICVACFVTGLCAALLRPAPASVTENVVVHQASAPVAKTDSPPAPPARVASPAELELRAEMTLVKADAARQFREAGDLYLRDQANYRAALRCYRNFLDEADPADLAVTPDDTWLLTSLKRAREQESAQ